MQCRYPEKEEVLENLTKHLVSLYEKADKPTSAQEYLENNFAGKEIDTLARNVSPLEKDLEDDRKNVTDKNSHRSHRKAIENETVGQKEAAPEETLCSLCDSRKDNKIPFIIIFMHLNQTSITHIKTT